MPHCLRCNEHFEQYRNKRFCSRDCKEQRYMEEVRIAKRARIAEKTGFICALCRKPVDLTIKSPHPDSPSIDHIVPTANGGTDDESNLQIAHLKCNKMKGKNSA